MPTYKSHIPQGDLYYKSCSSNHHLCKSTFLLEETYDGIDSFCVGVTVVELFIVDVDEDDYSLLHPVEPVSGWLHLLWSVVRVVCGLEHHQNRPAPLWN